MLIGFLASPSDNADGIACFEARGVVRLAATFSRIRKHFREIFPATTQRLYVLGPWDTRKYAGNNSTQY